MEELAEARNKNILSIHSEMKMRTEQPYFFRLQRDNFEEQNNLRQSSMRWLMVEVERRIPSVYAKNSKNQRAKTFCGKIRVWNFKDRKANLDFWKNPILKIIRILFYELRIRTDHNKKDEYEPEGAIYWLSGREIVLDQRGSDLAFESGRLPDIILEKMIFIFTKTKKSF